MSSRAPNPPPKNVDRPPPPPAPPRRSTLANGAWREYALAAIRRGRDARTPEQAADYADRMVELERERA